MIIRSGGQTGVDRAALDVARKLNIPYEGWCPKGRLAEDGVIDNKYLLKETPSSHYSERTKFNIRDSDGTLIIVTEIPITINDGTILTIQEAQVRKKPYMIIELSKNQSSEAIYHWIAKHHIQRLNIAGPRESQSPGIYKSSFDFLENLLQFIDSRRA